MMIITIGRNPENTIVLNDPSISGKHAELDFLDNGQILLKDFSTNGTYASGQFVNQSSVYVSYGDSIFFPGNVPLDWALVGSLLNQSREEQQPQQPSPAPQPVYQSQSAASSGANCGAQSAGSPSWPGNAVTINFSQTLSESFSIGFGNFGTCGLAILLWVLTCWIPYLNLGTFYGITAMLNAWAKGEPFKATDIFDSKYRRMLPELLLTSTFKASLILFGILLIIPAFVFILSTSLSTLIVIDRGYSPVEAVKESNRITYGSKWTMFGVQIILNMILSAVMGVFGAIFGALSFLNPVACAFIALLEFLIIIFGIIPIYYGMTTSIWRQLSQNL